MIYLFDALLYIVPLTIIGIIVYVLVRRGAKKNKANDPMALSGGDAFFELMTLASFGFLALFISEINARFALDVNWYNLILPVFVLAIAHSYYFKSLLSLEVGLVGVLVSLYANMGDWFDKLETQEILPMFFAIGIIFYCLYKLHYNFQNYKKISYVYLINSVVSFGILCIYSIVEMGVLIEVVGDETGFVSSIFSLAGMVPLFFGIIAVGFLIALYSLGTIEIMEMASLIPMLFLQYFLPRINSYLLVESARGGSSLTSFGVLYLIVSVLFSLACLFGLQHLAGKRGDTVAFGLFNGASVFFLVAMIFPRLHYDVFSTIVFNLVGFGVMVAYLLFAYQVRNEKMINTGVFLFALMIIIQYVNTFSGLDKSVVFITAGFLLLILGWGMEKGRKYLLTYIRNEKSIIQ